jgi:hypothetical protein
MKNAIVLDTVHPSFMLATRAVYMVYIRVNAVRNNVAKTCEKIAKAFANSLSANNDLATSEGYKISMVQELLRLKGDPPAIAPVGENDFLSWLDEN